MNKVSNQRISGLIFGPQKVVVMTGWSYGWVPLYCVFAASYYEQCLKCKVAAFKCYFLKIMQLLVVDDLRLMKIATVLYYLNPA